MRHNEWMLPVILAGGEGRRLAPIATPARPKPFVPLPGGKSLFSLTCERLQGFEGAMPPVIVGQEAHRFSLLNHARDAATTPQAILLEPRPHNTAMAVAVAVAWAQKTAPDAVLAILPADHAITPVQQWREDITQAAKASQAAETLCLLAIKPTHASNAYGYMALAAESSGARAVERFVEKPESPEILLEENGTNPRWYWNSGQFIGPVKCFVDAFRKHAPDIWQAAERAIAPERRSWEFILLEPSAYAGLPSVPFDKAVLEKEAAIIACEQCASWRDLGIVSNWEDYTKKQAADYKHLPLRVDRPWGYYETLKEGNGCIEKRLTVYPQCRLSLQRHHLRSEAWEIIDGTAHVELAQQPIILQKGDKLTIPAGCWHRLSNRTSNLLIINEIQSGFPDENDIERIDDDYDRL